MGKPRGFPRYVQQRYNIPDRNANGINMILIFAFPESEQPGEGSAVQRKYYGHIEFSSFFAIPTPSENTFGVWDCWWGE